MEMEFSQAFVLVSISSRNRYKMISLKQVKLRIRFVKKSINCGVKSQQNYDSETPLKNQWWIATIERYKALCSFGFSLHTQICTESSILGGWFSLKMSAFSMINVKSEREGWKRLRLPQRLSSSGLLANFYPNISSAPLIQSVVGLVLAVGSNKLDFYFPHNGPRGPPPALRQNHCNTFLLHNHFQYSAKKN